MKALLTRYVDIEEQELKMAEARIAIACDISKFRRYETQTGLCAWEVTFFGEDRPEADLYFHPLYGPVLELHPFNRERLVNLIQRLPKTKYVMYTVNPVFAIVEITDILDIPGVVFSQNT